MRVIGARKRLALSVVMASAYFVATMCSALANDKAVATPSLPYGALEEILTLLISEGSPLIHFNKVRPAGQRLQVRVSVATTRLPEKLSDVIVTPFDDTQAGQRLDLSVIAASETTVQIRAEVMFYTPKDPLAGAEGAEWQEMVFEFDGSNWRYVQTIRSAIK